MSENVASGVEDEPGRSRYVRSELRERVYARAGHRCEFESNDGTRCSSRTGLQIEHTRPFALFRSHDEGFLAALCPAHNRFMAERVYGTEFIQQKIDMRRKIDERRGRREVPEHRAPLPRAP